MATTAEKIFAIGDIHGCHDKLVTLMERLPFDRDRDTLVFLGDYIDRGPHARQVIDYLIELQNSCRNVVFLKGNHEQTLLEYHQTGDDQILRLLRGMGITATLASYGATMRQLQGLAAFPAHHRDFFHSLTFAHLTDTTVFTHADISLEMLTLLENGDPGHDNLDFTETILLSSRRLIRPDATTHGRTVVFGHTPFELPLVLPDRICIDTGAVYGNLLTALELPARTFYHA
ncbi:MAG: metallophosphoesterase family protein [Desulfopila sp.]